MNDCITLWRDQFPIAQIVGSGSSNENRCAVVVCPYCGDQHTHMFTFLQAVDLEEGKPAVRYAVCRNDNSAYRIIMEA